MNQRLLFRPLSSVEQTQGFRQSDPVCSSNRCHPVAVHPRTRRSLMHICTVSEQRLGHPPRRTPRLGVGEIWDMSSLVGTEASLLDRLRKTAPIRQVSVCKRCVDGLLFGVCIHQSPHLKLSYELCAAANFSVMIRLNIIQKVTHIQSLQPIMPRPSFTKTKSSIFSSITALITCRRVVLVPQNGTSIRFNALVEGSL